MGDDEIRYHIQSLIKHRHEQAERGVLSFRTFVYFEPLNFCNWDDVGHILTEHWCKNLPLMRYDGINIFSAMLCETHWIPLWIVPAGRVMVAHTYNDDVDFDIVDGKLRWMGLHMGFNDVVIHRIPNQLQEHRMCGANAMALLAHIALNADLPENREELATYHANMRGAFVQALYEEDFCRCPVVWGEGGTGTLVKSLAAELERRGVPPDLVEQRAAQAIKVLGSEQVFQALQHRQSWKQLKNLANNASFKFVLPSELEKNIAENKGKPVGKKSAKDRPSPTMPDVAALDVDKLRVLDGVFRADGQILHQIHQQQIGPVSNGFVLISAQDAEPYLKANKQVSKEPLALVVFCRPDVEISTMLPHGRVTVPCRCTVNQEPILADAVLVQIGGCHVEKVVGSKLVNIESPDVITLKINVFQDEFADSWDAFCKSPIRSIVQLVPELKRCSEEGCNCQCWHNEDALPIKEPILDLWRRQFLRHGYQQSEPSKADFFTVFMRVPACLMTKILGRSGIGGLYVEPRSADGRTVLTDFMVIWAGKHTLKDLLHMRQTNPAVAGLARVGDRRGLRVVASQAQEVHQLIKPDTLFLPQGDRVQYLVGPFPFGSDRQGISKAMRQAGWNCRPLQPTTPQPGRGVMWLVQAIDEPPQPIVWTSQGEILISKHKGPDQPFRQEARQTIASASTLALCGASLVPLVVHGHVAILGVVTNRPAPTQQVPMPQLPQPACNRWRTGSRMRSYQP